VLAQACREARLIRDSQIAWIGVAILVMLCLAVVAMGMSMR